MNYIAGFIRFIIGIVTITIGAYGIYQHFGGYEKDVTRLEKLKNEGQITLAVLDSTVLEISIKGLKSYQLDYKFRVDGKPFKGKLGFSNYEELDSLTPIVTYLPSNPLINTLRIDKELAEAKKRVVETNSSSLEVLLRIGLIIFGLFSLFAAYRRFKTVPTTVSANPSTPSPPQNSDIV